MGATPPWASVLNVALTHQPEESPKAVFILCGPPFLLPSECPLDFDLHSAMLGL